MNLLEKWYWRSTKVLTWPECYPVTNFWRPFTTSFSDVLEDLFQSVSIIFRFVADAKKSQIAKDSGFSEDLATELLIFAQAVWNVHSESPKHNRYEADWWISIRLCEEKRAALRSGTWTSYLIEIMTRKIPFVSWNCLPEFLRRVCVIHGYAILFRKFAWPAFSREAMI